MRQIEGEGEEQSSLYEKMTKLLELRNFTHANFQLKMMIILQLLIKKYKTSTY